MAIRGRPVQPLQVFGREHRQDLYSRIERPPYEHTAPSHRPVPPIPPVPNAERCIPYRTPVAPPTGVNGWLVVSSSSRAEASGGKGEEDGASCVEQRFSVTRTWEVPGIAGLDRSAGANRQTRLNAGRSGAHHGATGSLSIVVGRVRNKPPQMVSFERWPTEVHVNPRRFPRPQPRDQYQFVETPVC